MANDSIRGRQVVYRLTNKSGGALVEGDVVILSSGTAAAVTTTTTAGLTTDIIGVCLESIAGDAIGRVCFAGYVPKINLSGAASLGDTFATHTVAKQAAPAAARGQGHFGEVLGTGTTPAALLWGLPDPPTAAGNIATDAIWDAAGDLVQGTGANTAGRLAIGTANQLLRTNAAANAVEWASVGRVLLSEQTPTGTGTVTFSTIPGTYRNLEIEWVARSTVNAATDAGAIKFNTDATDANYRRMSIQGTLASTISGAGSDDRYVFECTGNTAPANSAGMGFIKIIQYAGTTFNKNVISFDVIRAAANNLVNDSFMLEWENAAAITQIDIVLSGGNYNTGSTFRLYGVF